MFYGKYIFQMIPIIFIYKNKYQQIFIYLYAYYIYIRVINIFYSRKRILSILYIIQKALFNMLTNPNYNIEHQHPSTININHTNSNSPIHHINTKQSTSSVLSPKNNVVYLPQLDFFVPAGHNKHIQGHHSSNINNNTKNINNYNNQQQSSILIKNTISNVSNNNLNRFSQNGSKNGTGHLKKRKPINEQQSQQIDKEKQDKKRIIFEILTSIEKWLTNENNEKIKNIKQSYLQFKKNITQFLVDPAIIDQILSQNASNICNNTNIKNNDYNRSQFLSTVATSVNLTLQKQPLKNQSNYLKNNITGNMEQQSTLNLLSKINVLDLMCKQKDQQIKILKSRIKQMVNRFNLELSNVVKQKVISQARQMSHFNSIFSVGYNLAANINNQILKKQSQIKKQQQPNQQKNQIQSLQDSQKPFQTFSMTLQPPINNNIYTKFKQQKKNTQQQLHNNNLNMNPFGNRSPQANNKQSNIKFSWDQDPSPSFRASNTTLHSQIADLQNQLAASKAQMILLQQKNAQTQKELGQTKKYLEQKKVQLDIIRNQLLQKQQCESFLIKQLNKRLEQVQQQMSLQRISENEAQLRNRTSINKKQIKQNNKIKRSNSKNILSNRTSKMSMIYFSQIQNQMIQSLKNELIDKQANWSKIEKCYIKKISELESEIYGLIQLKNITSKKQQQSVMSY